MSRKQGMAIPPGIQDAENHASDCTVVPCSEVVVFCLLCYVLANRDTCTNNHARMGIGVGTPTRIIDLLDAG